MSTLVLIRHAETDLARKFCGQADPDLNAAGEQQLASLVGKVAPLGVRRIYSSDLRRALRTAMAVSQRIGVTVEVRPGLREIDFGLWEGLSWEEIQSRYAQEAELWQKEFPRRSPPGGEDYADFVARLEGEFNSLFDDTRDLTAAVVTHRGVMRYVLPRFFGFSEADAGERTEQHGAVVVATRAEESLYQAKHYRSRRV